jgi:hypothetical protein
MAKADMISEGGPVAPVEGDENVSPPEPAAAETASQSISEDEAETKPE